MKSTTTIGHPILVTALALLGATSDVSAQTGGFVATLGTDTVQVESFRRDGDRITGTIIARSPAFTRVEWSMSFSGSRLTRYEQKAFNADGQPVLNGRTGSFTVAGDSLTREAYQAGQLVTSRLAAPATVLPAFGLPYIGTTFLIYELGLAPKVAGDTALYSLSLNAGMRSVQRSRAWIIGSDSAELDYFNVARSGYRFDGAGQLIRADWTRTTYRYRVIRVASVDLERTATGWAEAERAGHGFGALSPRDSSKATVGNAELSIDYSRPSQRGRNLWGDVVPFDKVWRLGADMATHFATSADLMIGETKVPAGRYTLWMIASDTAPMLIVSSAVNVFGTNYAPTKDFARIPLTRRTNASGAERLTLSVANGVLLIQWGTVGWSVPVKEARLTVRLP